MHWSRWGDPDKAHPLSDNTRALVEAFVGELVERPAVALPEVVLPPVGLDDVQLEELVELFGADQVSWDDEARVHCTRGKSTLDLLRMRDGDASDAPDAVVRPADHDEVQRLIGWAIEQNVALVPFGGGTSVVGGLAARREGYAGVVAVHLTDMKRLIHLDRESSTATLEAGLLGPEAEALLAAEGFMLGHFPQSFLYATIGGFAATRSSGQSSSGYGRFDAIVVGMRVATPIGEMRLGSAPANAAGPDLREVLMGSEGAFGVITEVTLRVRPLPVEKVYEAWRFESFVAGAAAMREMAQAGIAPTVLRLSDETETAVNLAKPDEVGGASVGGCLMITGFEGTEAAVARQHAIVTEALTALGGVSEGPNSGDAWASGRFDGPYLRDSLLDLGVLVETLETATFWSNLHTLYAKVKSAIEAALTEQGTPPIVMCHISHVYATGASLYFTVAAKELDAGQAQWSVAKTAASDAMIASGATITHHHAVGRDHKAWFAEEIGPIGVAMLRSIKATMDPHGVMNPGILIP
jgi:alkyldihydroxyacetonephosphate synthase